ncbi:hypothetical protein ACQ4PT_071448 [Festuca glaucescens]
MDKSWMVEDRHTEKYINGVKGFIQFAFSHSAKGNTILCPCKKCLNCSWLEASHVLEHLVCEGFVNGYRRWEYHGEASSSLESGRDAHVQQFDEVEENDDLEEDCDELAGMMRDMRHDFGDLSDVEDEGDCREPTNESDPFKQLVGDAEEQLYPGCTCFSKLRFVVRLLHIKSLGGWSDKSFNMLLELQKEAFPKGSKLPKNFHEAKKMIRCLRLDYVSIHACDNDCILFWKEHANADCCPKCKASRWKSQKKRPDGRAAHKVPVKVLRYFPIAKRLQRLFISAKSATDCRWHDEGRTKDGLLRHPADSPAWKHFDAIHTRFAEDSRNIRLIIATDGFNPYRSMNCAYSVWPVIAIPINLPPWVCMKQPNFILTLLIPGPKSPGRDIDVFLEPLIDDLHLLFEKGVRTYDASMSQHFQLHAAVHSTITDLPGLATLVGVVTSGEYGCPKCHLLTCSRWLTNGKKTCYMDHRRFLVRNHRFRTIDKAFFDGNVESRTAPEPLTGEEVDALTRNMETVFGKDPTGKQTIRKRKRGDPPQIFKRRSIWFRLPYWKDLLQPHNIDAMHIEKNVCDNIVNTLLGINGKTKDNTNSRRDLELFNIRTDLHPVPVGKDTFDLPPASYSMSPELKRLFCQVLKGAMFPHGYASDIRKNVHVKEKKIAGLKSHDCHVLLQQLFPLAVRKTLPEGVSAALIRVSRFFKKIYAPVIRISDMEKLEEEIAETLSILETIFLPSFFDMMVHLMVHLPLQVRLGGPVKYSNMFPIERFLCTLKGYVRTKSHPEGSIAEGYIFYECLNFCARYFERCETRISRLVRNDDPEPMSSSMPFFNGGGRYLAGKYTITLDRNAWLQAHRYVLFNYDNITPYLSKHLEYLSSTGQRNALQIDKIHHDEFHEWLRLHVAHLVDSGKRMAREEGSSEEARTYGDVCEEQVARNTEKMKSLGLAVISSEMKALKKAAGKPKKKRALEVAIPESTRVLRSQSVMHESDNEEDADNEQELEENEELGLDDQQKKKKDGRKRTRMHTVYDRGNQPPVPVSFNEKGQPNGDNASEFSNFIATLVKTHIPLGHEDWRLVPVEKKNALLTTLRKYYVVDDKLKDYVMGTSHKKWRDFKADLKKKFFKPEKTDEEILTLRVEDNRVSYDDCVWLIKFWRSEEAEKRSEQGKKNRSSQKVLHTSGSKSHARVAAEMHKEKGYAPRRDEVFVRTHISKRDETTMTAETSKVIKDIDTAIEEHPELLEKSIQQGDILSHVLGKERNGYVRCVGLGPTAGSLGIPGAQKLKSTKLQMAELEAEKAWRTNEALMDHMDYFKEDTKAQMDALMAEMAEMRSMLSQSIAGNKNFMHTSEIQPEASVGEYSTADQSIHDVDSIEAAQLIRKKKEAAQRLNNEAELQKRKEAELLHKKKEEALMQKNNEQDMQKKREIESKKKQEDLMQKKKEQDMQKKREADLKKKKEATVTQKNHQKGNEVILFNVYRDHTTPVAKATILATDRKKIVGGRELGTECCEVVVNYIIKRDAILPRPIGDVTTMGQAQGRTIAWLYKHLEVDKSKMKQASPPQEE